jgi:hypothetical protein
MIASNRDCHSGMKSIYIFDMCLNQILPFRGLIATIHQKLICSQDDVVQV